MFSVSNKREIHCRWFQPTALWAPRWLYSSPRRRATDQPTTDGRGLIAPWVLSMRSTRSIVAQAENMWAFANVATPNHTWLQRGRWRILWMEENGGGQHADPKNMACAEELTDVDQYRGRRPDPQTTRWSNCGGVPCTLEDNLSPRPFGKIPFSSSFQCWSTTTWRCHPEPPACRHVKYRGMCVDSKQEMLNVPTKIFPKNRFFLLRFLENGRAKYIL